MSIESTPEYLQNTRNDCTADEISAAFLIGQFFKAEVVDSEVDAAQHALILAIENNAPQEELARLQHNLKHFQNERILVRGVYMNSHQAEAV